MANLHKEKLIKKLKTDKTGKKVTRWVRPEDIKSERGKKSDEPSTSKNQAILEKFASATSTEKLQAYVNKQGSDESLKKIANNELKKRQEGGNDTGDQKNKNNTTEAKKSVKKDEIRWYDDLISKYQLDRLPVGLEREEVVVDESSPEKSWVMRWKDKKTGKTTFAYSREFLQRNAEDKWNRIQKIKPKDIEQVRKKTLELLDSKNKKVAEAAAIIHILSITGLRVGDKRQFKVTGNRGVSTLSANCVEIDGDSVSLNFIGKSYKQNKSVIDSPELSGYLSKLLKKKKGDDFLFDVNKQDLVKMYKEDMGFKNNKLKDIRTYVATEKAKEILYNDPTSPPPIGKKNAKLEIQKKLKHVFNEVSLKLCNTPAMAKSSYVLPQVIDKWLIDLGVERESVLKGELESEELIEPTLEDIKQECEKNIDPLSGEDYDEEVIDDDFVEDTFPLPDFMENMDENDIKKAHLTGNKSAGYSLKEIAKKHNVTLKQIMQQLKIGVKIESEHTDDKQIAKEIAKDHLFEISDYYTRLIEMEKETEEEEVLEKAGRDLSKLKKIKKIVQRDGKMFMSTYYVNPADYSNVKKEDDERELLKLKKKFRTGMQVTWTHSKFGELSGEIKSFFVSDIDKSGLAVIEVPGKGRFNVSLLKLQEGGKKKIEKTDIDFPDDIDDVEEVRHLGGSSGVNLVSYGDKLFAKKTARDRMGSKDQIIERVFADEIYKSLGLLVPESKIYGDGAYRLSEFIDGKELGGLSLVETKKVSKDLENTFVIDAFLANWDVIGPDLANVVVKDGKCYRIDTDGSLRFRARGGKKGSEFGEKVGELSTMREREPGKDLYKNLTKEQINEQIRELLKHRGEVLKSVIRVGKAYDRIDSAIELNVILEKRFDYLKSELERKEREKKEDKGEYESIVTKKYFEDWDEFKFETEHGEDWYKKRIAENIVATEKNFQSTYEEYAAKHGLTVEEYKEKAQEKAEKFARSSEIFRATNFEAIEGILFKTGRFLSQFETGTSDGSLYPELRASEEMRFFGFPPEKDKNKELRPIYGYYSSNKHGVQNREGEHPPSNAASQYGLITVKFRKEIRKRSTITISDSLGDEYVPVPIEKPHFTMFGMSDALSMVSSTSLCDSYTETQIHGGVHISDIEGFHISALNFNSSEFEGMKDVNEFLNKYARAVKNGHLKEIDDLPMPIIYGAK